MATKGIPNAKNTVFLICDVQETFRHIGLEFSSVVRVGSSLLDASAVFGCPAIVTEQYPKALGVSAAELNVRNRGGTENIQVFEKTRFSMMTNEVKSHLDELGFKNTLNDTHFVIAGLEAHVCVQQTTLELLQLGSHVHVCVDGVSSQRSLDRSVALNRMERAGAYLTTMESVLFTMAQDAKNPNFKQVSNIAKEYGKNPSKLSFNGSL